MGIKNMPGPRMPLLLAAGFLAIGLLIYSNVILHGVFILDDYEYVLDNPLSQNLSSFSLSDPRQVGYLSFALNFMLGGDNPRWYHLVNVLIHIANAMMAFFLIRAILGQGAGPNAGKERGNFDVTAALAGLFFLVHPLATQSVSYITQRFTSLAALFYLLAAFWYLAARKRFEATGEERRAYRYYIASFLCALLAMRTKEIAFTLPFAVGLFELMLFRESRYGRRRYLFLFPFTVLLIVIPLSIIGPEFGIMSRGEGIAEVTRAEKILDMTQRSWFEYFFTQFRVIVTYLRLLVLPVGQTVVYDVKVSRTLWDPRVLASIALLLSFAWYGLVSWRRSLLASPGERAGHVLIALGIAWFYLTLSVESSVIPIKDLIFEHRTYLPSVGFFAICSVVLVRASTALSKSVRQPVVLAVIAMAIALPLAIGTYVRNDVWTDELKFWDDVVRKTPEKAIGYHNRGNEYAKRGQIELALQDMDRTINSFPRNPDVKLNYENADFTQVNMAKTYMNRGTVYLNIGEKELAEKDFEKSKMLISLPPVDIAETLKLAEVYYQRGAYKHAIKEYEKILQWDPENIDALNNRANSFSRSGNYRNAISDLSRIIVLYPDSALAYHNRGIAYAWSGSKDKAVSDFTKACGLGFKPACESRDIVRKDGR